MPRLSTFSVLLLLAFAVPVTDVMAQSSAGRGAVGGAIIGGAIGGRRGAAVGAATGAVVGAHHRHRHWHGHYYWRHGRCWVRIRREIASGIFALLPVNCAGVPSREFGFCPM